MLKLYTGKEISCLGLGARGIPLGKVGEEEYKKEYDFYSYALSTGKCFLYDTSAAYGRNDEALGNAIEDSGFRDRVEIMSKISNQQQLQGNIRRQFEAHLKYLHTDYLDYYLIHWPQPTTYISVYKEMEHLYEEGLVKAIGVCNCNIHHLKELAAQVNIQPMINQFEITPLLTQDSLINYCKAFDILPIAYSAIGRMHDVLIKAEPIRKLAEKYGKSSAQIIIKWHEQLNHVALVQTRNVKHFRELFFENQDYLLTEKEIYWINSLNSNIRLRFDPDMADYSIL